MVHMLPVHGVAAIPNPVQAAQAVLVPFLVDRERVDHSRLSSLSDMMAMRTPQVSPPTASASPASSTTSNVLPWRHAPAAAASWRLQLLRQGDVDDAVLASIRYVDCFLPPCFQHY